MRAMICERQYRTECMKRNEYKCYIAIGMALINCAPHRCIIIRAVIFQAIRSTSCNPSPGYCALLPITAGYRLRYSPFTYCLTARTRAIFLNRPLRQCSLYYSPINYSSIAYYEFCRFDCDSFTATSCKLIFCLVFFVLLLFLLPPFLACCCRGVCTSMRAAHKMPTNSIVS